MDLGLLARPARDPFPCTAKRHAEGPSTSVSRVAKLRAIRMPVEMGIGLQEERGRTEAEDWLAPVFEGGFIRRRASRPHLPRRAAYASIHPACDRNSPLGLGYLVCGVPARRDGWTGEPGAAGQSAARMTTRFSQFDGSGAGCFAPCLGRFAGGFSARTQGFWGVS
jgi:hypothetical protein